MWVLSSECGGCGLSDPTGRATGGMRATDESSDCKARVAAMALLVVAPALVTILTDRVHGCYIGPAPVLCSSLFAYVSQYSAALEGQA
jgi:hypothetical protein